MVDYLCSSPFVYPYISLVISFVGQTIYICEHVLIIFAKGEKICNVNTRKKNIGLNSMKTSRLKFSFFHVFYKFSFERGS